MAKHHKIKATEKRGIIKKRIISLLEAVTTIAILLVILQTFLEDLSLFLLWNPNLIFAIKVSAVFFDLFFTIEFLTRFIVALNQKRASVYFLKERGWIDLIASVPLLFLVSGPYFIGIVTGKSVLGALTRIAGGGRALKVVKTIRVTRVLRFVRMLKIFGKIKNVQSKMAQRHINRLCTTTVFSLTLFFIVMGLFQNIGVFPDHEAPLVAKEELVQSQIVSIIQAEDEETVGDQLAVLVETVPEIYLLSWKENSVIDNLNRNKMGASVLPVTSEWIQNARLREIDLPIEVEPISGLRVVFSRIRVLQQEALNGMINFILILFMIGIILLFYAPHFAKTVTDPIFVMRKGFEKRKYTLAVKIPQKYEEDDVYRLAKDYNSRWLPAKMRKLTTSHIEEPKLRLEDILNMDLPDINDSVDSH